MIEFSIVIPVLNGERFLSVQLDALCAQVGAECEVVISDNGSTDGSLNLVRSYGNRLRIQIVDASLQPGQAHARNEGARASQGNCILFLDQDDEIGPGYLNAMKSALAIHKFVAARMDGIALNQGWKQQARTLPQTDGIPGGFRPWAYGCTLGIRRETFFELGGFDESLPVRAGEDIDFCWRANAAGTTVVFVHDAILRYRYPLGARNFFRQGQTYGYSQVIVERRHGINKPRWREIVRSFAGPVWMVLRGPSRGMRVHGLFLVGRRVGTLRAAMTTLCPGRNKSLG